MFYKNKYDTETMVKIPTKNYKESWQLTAEDIVAIMFDRRNTGIYDCDDEYYFNNVLNQNYDIACTSDMAAKVMF